MGEVGLASDDNDDAEEVLIDIGCCCCADEDSVRVEGMMIAGGMGLAASTDIYRCRSEIE
jgi:hypothetical protein